MPASARNRSSPHKQRFPRSRRIIKTEQFTRVLGSRNTGVSGPYYWRCRANRLPHPRLGLVVAKRWCKKAVLRNYVKRTIRESFRAHQNGLVGLDVVVGLRRPLSDLRHLNHQKYLERIWNQVRSNCATA